MVTKILVERDIEAGRALLEALDNHQVPVSTALWLYDDGGERYRLTIATTIYDSGPLDAYGTVRRVLDQLDLEVRPSLPDVNIVSPSDPIVQAIHKIVESDSRTGDFRFNGNTIDGIYVEDAWIYFSR